MTRKRSSYRPKGVNPEAWKVGMQGAMRLSIADQIKTLGKVRVGVDALIDSKPSEQAWAPVFDCINLLDAFVHGGVIKDGGRELVEHLQESVVAAMDRQKETRSTVLRPVEVEALREMLEAYGQVLDVCTHRELLTAHDRVVRKVRQALAAGSRGSVRILEAA